MTPNSGEWEHILPSQRTSQTHTNNQKSVWGKLLVSHGLRAFASTILNEEGKVPDLVETALVRIDANQVRSACNRAGYLERRRECVLSL